MSKTVQVPLQREADLKEAYERKSRALEAAMLDIQNLQTDLVAKNRQLTMLKTELAKLERRHAPQKEVEDLWGHYLIACGKTKSRMSLDEKRQQMIRKALKLKGFDYCKQAIDGLASRPFVARTGRTGNAQAPDARRFDDIKYALRDAETLEKAHAWGEEREEPRQARHLHAVPSVDAGHVTKQDIWQRPLDRAVAALRREFGRDATMASYRSENPEDQGYWAVDWFAPCPLHPAIGMPLRLRERGHKHGARLDVACANGCLPSLILQELRVMEYRRVNGSLEGPPDELRERWAQRAADLGEAA